MGRWPRGQPPGYGIGIRFNEPLGGFSLRAVYFRGACGMEGVWRIDRSCFALNLEGAFEALAVLAAQKAVSVHKLLRLEFLNFQRFLYLAK